jgi:hypothetical protein
VRIKVVRSFFWASVRHEAGGVIDVSPAAARELVATGKAELAPDEVMPPAGPMTTENSPGLVHGRKRKGAAAPDEGDSNAG